MAVQTSYSFDPKIAFAGMIAEGSPKAVRSMRNVNASDQPFGILWRKDTTDDQSAQPFDGVTAQVVGISLNQFARDNIGLSTSTAVGIKGTTTTGGPAMFDCLSEGAIYVTPEEAVDPSKPVYVRFATGTGTQLGSFRASNDTNTAMRLVGARWLSTGSSTVPAVLYFSASEQIAGPSPVDFTFDQASESATTSHLPYVTRTDRMFVVDEVTYNNPTGLAGSDTNNYVLALKNGSTVMAQYSTAITGGQSTIAANTPTDLILSGTAANLIANPGSTLTLSETLTGTLTLPAGRYIVHGHYV